MCIRVRKLMKYRAALVVGALLLLTNSANASIFVTGLSNGVNPLPIPGNQAWEGQLGDDFTVTSTIRITDIGVFDSNGDGTSSLIHWQMYDVTNPAAPMLDVPVAPSLA